jgi:hypothetical protein
VSGNNYRDFHLNLIESLNKCNLLYVLCWTVYVSVKHIAVHVFSDFILWRFVYFIISDVYLLRLVVQNWSHFRRRSVEGQNLLCFVL